MSELPDNFIALLVIGQRDNSTYKYWKIYAMAGYCIGWIEYNGSKAFKQRRTVITLDPVILRREIDDQDLEGSEFLNLAKED